MGGYNKYIKEVVLLLSYIDVGQGQHCQPIQLYKFKVCGEFQILFTFMHYPFSHKFHENLTETLFFLLTY